MTAIRNREIVLYESAARTATPATENLKIIQNDEWSHISVYINTTAVTSTPSTVFTLQAVNHLGATFDLIASAAVTGTGKTVLHVGPGITATANVSVNQPLPVRFQLAAAHGNANSHTYSAVAHLTGS